MRRLTEKTPLNLCKVATLASFSLDLHYFQNVLK